MAFPPSRDYVPCFLGTLLAFGLHSGALVPGNGGEAGAMHTAEARAPSIAQACRKDVVCLWDAIDAAALCRSRVEESLQRPPRWVDGPQRFHFALRDAARPGIVTYQADDVQIQHANGDYVASAYACDIDLGGRSPIVIRTTHRPGRMDRNAPL